MYIIEIDGELSFHNDFEGPWDREYYQRVSDAFDCLTIALAEKGMNYLDTWINDDDEVNYEFVQRFGFLDTDTVKLVRIGDQEFRFRVMRCLLPTDEVMDHMESVRE